MDTGQRVDDFRIMIIFFKLIELFITSMKEFIRILLFIDK